MFCFAYASNMDWDQMKRRSPSARFVGVAVLRDHRLAFTRRSEQRKCGVADAVPADGKSLWGVVYQIDEREVGQLDASEGCRPGQAEPSYRRDERHVFLDDNDERPLAVHVYFAEQQNGPPPPSAAYKQLILSGARHWHLPDGYVRELETIEVSE